MFDHEEGGYSDVEYSSKGPRGRRRGRKKSVVKEFKLDQESKNRIRRTPDILKFYEFVHQFKVREEAFKALVFMKLDDAEAKRVKKLLNAKPGLTPVEA